MIRKLGNKPADRKNETMYFHPPFADRVTSHQGTVARENSHRQRVERRIHAEYS